VYGLALIAVVLTGCSKGVSEKDFVGSWIADPASPEKVDHPEVRSKLLFTLTADHKFSMTSPTPAGFEGSWVIEKGTRKVDLTPTTLVIENPLQPGVKTRLPISEALQKVKAKGGNPQMEQELKKASAVATFELAEDGKKMSEDGKPALMKSGP